MSEVQPVLLGRRREPGELVDKLEAVTLPFLQQFRPFRRLRNREERRAAAVLIAERFEAEEASGAAAIDDSKGFFERLVDWLADPENRAKLEAIIAWLIGLFETFGGAPA